MWKQIVGLALSAAVLSAVGMARAVQGNQGYDQASLIPRGNPDYAVLETVLTDLATFKELDFINRDRAKTQIILDSHTPDKAGMLTDSQITSDIWQEKGITISAELRNDIRKRNPWKAISLTDFRPTSPDILVRDVSSMRRSAKF